jgi:hypothetical protein
LTVHPDKVRHIDQTFDRDDGIWLRLVLTDRARADKLHRLGEVLQSLADAILIKRDMVRGDIDNDRARYTWSDL